MPATTIHKVPKEVAASAADALAKIADATVAHPENLADDVRSGLEKTAASWTAPNEPPSELVARECPVSAAAWHLASLEGCLLQDADDDVDLCRRRYHAMWLGHLLFPEDPRFVPTVSVVIPCYNGSDCIADAVTSCLDQTWPSVEVIVVDDGSTDDLDGALERFLDRICLVRKENGGVSSARNAGMRAATGELVHFLDGDDVLDQDGIAAKMEAMRAVGDADVCMSSYRSIGTNGFKNASTHVAPPIRGVDSPTIDLMSTVVRRYAIHTSTVLSPRWVLLDNGFFEEDLRQSEDTRYWFQLGLRGTKVIGIDRALNTRRFVPGSLTSKSDAHRRYWGIAFLRNLNEIIRQPNRWPYVAQHIRRSRNPVCWNAFNSLEDASLEHERERFLEGIADLSHIAAEAGISSKPLLTVLQTFVRAARSRHGDGPAATGFYPRLDQAFRDAAARAPELGPSDVALWTEAPVTLQFPSANRAALRVVFRWVHARLLAGDRRVRIEDLPAMSKCWPRHPWRRRWKTVSWLRRFLGDARAGSAVRKFEQLYRPVENVVASALTPLRKCLAPFGRFMRRSLWSLETRVWEWESRPGIGPVVSWLKFVKKRIRRSN